MAWRLRVTHFLLGAAAGGGAGFYLRQELQAGHSFLANQVRRKPGGARAVFSF